MKYYKSEINFYWRDEDNIQWNITVTYYIKSSKELHKDDLYGFDVNDVIKDITEIKTKNIVKSSVKFEEPEVEYLEEISEEEYKKARTSISRLIFKFNGKKLLSYNKLEAYVKEYWDRIEKENNSSAFKMLKKLYEYHNIEVIDKVAFFAFDEIDFIKGSNRFLLIQKENENVKDIQKKIQKVLKENLFDENMKYKISFISGSKNFAITENICDLLEKDYIHFEKYFEGTGLFEYNTKGKSLDGFSIKKFVDKTKQEEREGEPDGYYS